MPPSRPSTASPHPALPDREESHSFLFADLAGFTALTEAHGDHDGAEIAEHFVDAVKGLLPAERAEVVKTIGDEVMVRTRRASDAVDLGRRIVDELARHRSPPVRVGIHSGPAVEVEGDWFGQPSTWPHGSARPLYLERCWSQPRLGLDSGRGKRTILPPAGSAASRASGNP